MKRGSLAKVRRQLLSARNSAEKAENAARSAILELNRVTQTEQLAITIRALKQIASRLETDDWSKGIARGALKAIGEETKR